MFSLAFFSIGSIMVSSPSSNVRLFLFVTWCDADVECETVATLRSELIESCENVSAFDALSVIPGLWSGLQVGISDILIPSEWKIIFIVSSNACTASSSQSCVVEAMLVI
jgi:hypothetical protein